MRKPSLINVSIFIMFFGVALVESLRSKNYLTAILWIVLGGIFLFADLSAKKRD